MRRLSGEPGETSMTKRGQAWGWMMLMVILLITIVFLIAWLLRSQA